MGKDGQADRLCRSLWFKERRFNQRRRKNWVGGGVVRVGVFVGYAFQPDNKALAAMFELAKTGALPLMTLVISFRSPKAV